MRFDRQARPDGFSWTARRQTLFLRRGERQKEKLQEAYPLFSDQLELPPSRTVEEEQARRERLFIQAEQRMRDLYAQQWRRTRSEYFACTPEQRARIMAEWVRWPGPAKPGAFSYVIEKHNGVGEEKSRAFRERERAMNARIDALLAAQSSLSLS
ncbi:hypothetical protein EN871_28965 [bacterium M00.F.Ca.ET.228.01.1.1]|nr:hypothetical protein EN871_28965 [bacterium M00.F.Ca.ET.228.01.1.1]TGR96489.1 hypothetical protein EN834_28015 [bacterium M00.F.Ca.ET.191.01.1.1]TGT97725.1 hypothetical protein EN798_28020 [bacterium M00.F.Ca.ET.155.01.1.1]